jgi:hypothetical protein
MMRVLQYLNGRKGVGINLFCEQDIHVYIYADASYHMLMPGARLENR